MKMYYLKFPKTSILYALVPLIMLLAACHHQKQLVFDWQQAYVIKPSKVYIFLDHSGSMQGFFHRQKSDVVELIGELGIDLKKNEIPVQFYSFSNSIDSIASNFREFKNKALDSNIYVGNHNFYSSVLDSIAHKQKLDSTALFLVLTDGVLSVPKYKSLSAEKASIKDALVGFSKSDNSIGVFQYRMHFNGVYYAQPHDTRIPHQGKRNFYAFTFGSQHFDSFTKTLLTNQKNALNHQYFKKYTYQSVMQNKGDCVPQLVANQQVRFLFMLPKGFDQTNEYWNAWEVLDTQKNKLDDVHIQAKKRGANQLDVLLDFGRAKRSIKPNVQHYLKLKRKTKVDTHWQPLSYPDSVQAEPKQASTFDHSKTFQLHTLLDAFHYLYKDSPVLELPFEVKPYHINYIGRVYTFVLGQQPTICWTHYLYYILFGIACLVALGVAIYVAKVNDDIIRNQGLSRRIYIGGISAAIVAILSIGAIYLFHCNSCIYQISLIRVLAHAGINSLWSLIPFFAFLFSLQRTTY